MTNINKEYFFDTKEDYLNFKKTWAEAVKSEKAKKVLIGSGNGAYQKKGWLQSIHHLIYNMVRDKPLDTGFKPITSEKILTSQRCQPDRAFKRALYQFEMFQQYGAESSIGKYIMEPFGKSISVDKLLNISGYAHK